MITKSELGTGILENDILCIYTYGSVVYGTATTDSDQDYIIVCRDGVLPTEKREFNTKPLIDVTVYSESKFQQLIDAHEISVLECLWLPDQLKYEERTFEFKLDRAKLRESISAKCSNSWVKGKKKLTVEKDYNPYIGKKSIWHSIRISEYGCQIATLKKIWRYDAVNEYLTDILSMPDDWETIKGKYQRGYNYFMSEFRKVAPK